jgi:hypothetical protein
MCGLYSNALTDGDKRCLLSLRSLNCNRFDGDGTMTVFVLPRAFAAMAAAMMAIMIICGESEKSRAGYQVNCTPPTASSTAHDAH